MNQIDQTIKNSLSFLDNEYINASVCVFLIIYTIVIVPRFPGLLTKLFSHDLFKLFALLSIVYVSRKDTNIAIIMAVAVVASLIALSNTNSDIVSASVPEDLQNRLHDDLTLLESTMIDDATNRKDGGQYANETTDVIDQTSESDFTEVTGWNSDDSLCTYEKLNRSGHAKKSSDKIHEDIISLKNTMIDEVIKRKDSEESTGAQVDIDRIKQICKDVAYDFETVHKNKMIGH